MQLAGGKKIETRAFEKKKIVPTQRAGTVIAQGKKKTRVWAKKAREIPGGKRKTPCFRKKKRPEQLEEDNPASPETLRMKKKKNNQKKVGQTLRRKEQHNKRKKVEERPFEERTDAGKFPLRLCSWKRKKSEVSAGKRGGRRSMWGKKHGMNF